MGPYSGVKISEEKHKDRRILIPGMNKKLNVIEDKVGLFKNPKYTDPLGEEAALNLKYKSGPPVDGREGSPNAMFMFAHNKCHQDAARQVIHAITDVSAQLRNSAIL